MKIFVDIINKQRLKKKLDKLRAFPKKRQMINTAARKAAKPLHAAIVAATPVRTGLLKKSVKLRTAKKSRTRFGVNVIVRKLDWSKAVATGKTQKKHAKHAKQWRIFYASFLELGTKKIKAREFMGRTAKKMGRRTQKQFIKNLDKQIKAAVQ